MSLKNLLFLSDTDTTIGFISQSKIRVDRAKKRPASKQYIKALISLKELKERERIPNIHRRRIRRSKGASYILPSGNSYRIVKDRRHLLLLKRLKWAYTSSANLSNYDYDEDYARENADIVIEKLGEPNSPSNIYRLTKRKIKRLR